MPKLERRLFSAAIVTGILVLVTASIFIPASAISSGHQQSGDALTTLILEKSTGSDATTVEPASTPFRLASLSGGALILPRMALSEAPRRIVSASEQAFAAAERFRNGDKAPEAVRAYLQIVETYPQDPQARIAYERIRRIVTTQTPEGLQAIEALLPVASEVSTVDGMAAIGVVWIARAKGLMKAEPDKFIAYVPKVYDLCWRILQKDPADRVGKTAVEVLLVAGDAMGKGAETRTKLSAYAESLSPCFTSWLIRTMGEKKEPPFDYVPTYEGRNLVLSYYLNTARDSKDNATKIGYFTKARDAALQQLMALPSDQPNFGHCHNYLVAAEALGADERKAAIEQIGVLLEERPMSISRWTTRYDRAEFLTREGNNPEDTHLGYLDFEALVNEANQSMLDKAINDPSVDGRTKGLLVCVLGHGYSGTNRIAEAESCYQWVLNNFPNEIHPEETAAFSLAVTEDRKNADTPTIGAAAYEEFLTTHPSGAYSADALLHAGKCYQRSNDTQSAVKSFRRALQEFTEEPDTMAKAEKALQELSPSS